MPSYLPGHLESRHTRIVSHEGESFGQMDADRFFIGIVTRGYAVVLLDGERCYLGKDTALCLAPGRTLTLLASHKLQVHAVSFLPAFINVRLNSEMIRSPEYPRLCQAYGYPDFSLFTHVNTIYNGILPLEEDEAAKQRQILERVIRHVADKADSSWSCRARLGVFRLMGLLEPQQKRLMGESVCTDPLVLDAISCIQRRLNEPLSLDMLCRELHVGRNALSRRFKLATGQTVIEYVIDRRMDLAKRLLAFTELPVGEIAWENGYAEQTYFTRLFRMREGMTPLQYRKRMREIRQAEESSPAGR